MHWLTSSSCTDYFPNRLMRYSPDIADLNLASFLLHWSSILTFYWSSCTLTSVKPDRCVLLSIGSGLIAPTPTSMSGWVSEWAVLFLHLPHLLRSGGRDPDPAGLMGSLHSFCFLQGGWCMIWEHMGMKTMCHWRECWHAAKWRWASGRSSYRMCISILFIRNYLFSYLLFYLYNMYM